MATVTPALIKQADMLERYFAGISPDTAERRLFKRHDFPKPIRAFPGMNLRSVPEVEAFVERLIEEGRKTA